MTYLGMTLDTAPRSFGWGHLANWARHLPAESATMRWAAASQREKRERATGSLDKRKLGRGAIPVSEFDDWYYGGE